MVKSKYIVSLILLKSFLIIIIVIQLINCGGSENISNVNNPSKSAIGVLRLSSPIGGVEYTTKYSSGVTDSVGRFEYKYYEMTVSEPDPSDRLAANIGKEITFSIGGIVLGDTKDKAVVTPVDLVEDANDISNHTVINISKFLLTLDDDGNPDNGIFINEAVRNAAVGKSVNFNLSTDEFENDITIQQLVDELTELTSAGQSTLVSTSDTQEQLDFDLPDTSGYGCGETMRCISGYVYDKSTNMPISDYMVQAYDNDDQGVIWWNQTPSDENGFYIIPLECETCRYIRINSVGGPDLGYPPTWYEEATLAEDATVFSVDENEHIENIILLVEKGVLVSVIVLDEDEDLIVLSPGKMIGVEIYDEEKRYINHWGVGGQSEDNEPGGVLKDGIFPLFLYSGKYYMRVIACGDPPEELYSYGYVPEWYHSDPTKNVTEIDDAELFEVLEPPTENIIFFYLKKY